MSSMLFDQAVLNRIWSELILEEIRRHGVQHICIAPGSRSTPLTLEASEQSQCVIHTHFDERGLGFLALGLAKASQSPVAVIVTSGTAVANLLPAIAEAKLTGEKLVILTADRPADLIDCGANQAISQTGIFSGHTVAALNLPSPNLTTPPEWLLTSIDQMMVAQDREGGAIHINCPFPEPLYSDKTKSEYAHLTAHLSQWRISSQPYTQYLPATPAVMERFKKLESYKGIILIGKLDLADAEKALELGRALGWPVLCDPQSGVSSAWQHYDLWLRNSINQNALLSGDLILQFGARLVSKSLNQCIKRASQQNNCRYILVSDENRRLNPTHLAQEHLQVSITSWVNAQLIDLGLSQYTGWAEGLKLPSQQVKKAIDKIDTFSEVGLAAQVPNIVGKRDLFVGNSLIVRLLDMVSALKGNRTYTNRGASGIDGLVATAAGVQRVNQEALMLILGDTSLLYDLNSLALFSHTSMPCVIMITNNDGGAIFNLLPVPEAKKRTYYQMPHGYQFHYAAKMFGLKYLKPDSMDELVGVACEHLDSGHGTLLVELLTPAEEAANHIKQLVSTIHALR